MRESRRQWWFLSAVIIALGLRIVAAVGWQWHLGDAGAFGFPDSDSYWQLAGRIAHGEPYQYGGPELSVFRAPAYPVVLAGLFIIGDGAPPVLWARLLGALLGTLAVIQIAWLAESVAGVRARPIAAWMAALYPGAIGMSVFILSEALFVPLLLAQLAAWVKAWQTPAWRPALIWATLGGVATGLAVLARPSWLLFVPMAAGVAIICARRRWRQVGIVATMALLAAITMMPWWVRNYRVIGTWVPTTLQVGASLYDGLNPRATGASNMWFSQSFYDALKAEDAARSELPRVPFEVRLNRRLRDAAVQWAAAHPTAVVRLAGKKFMRMWSPWPHAAEFQNLVVRLAVACGYIPLLLLGLCGAVRFMRSGWPFLLCVLPAVYFSLLHSVFVASIRYRQPAMIGLIVLAAACVTCCVRPAQTTDQV